MTQVTDAYLVAHAFELRLLVGVLAVIAAFSVIKLALLVGELVKSLRAKFAESESGSRSTNRLDAVGAR